MPNPALGQTEAMDDGALQGRRLPDAVFGEPGPGWDAYKDGQPGDYLKVDYDGVTQWWIRDPWGSVGRLTSHTITEHEDGTITVSPSIFDKDGSPPSQEEMQRWGIRAIIHPEGTGWHGWLERGVWRQA